MCTLQKISQYVWCTEMFVKVYILTIVATLFVSSLFHISFEIIGTAIGTKRLHRASGMFRYITGIIKIVAFYKHIGECILVLYKVIAEWLYKIRIRMRIKR